eukprot:TRINITY_DN35004_c0_g3_i2.p1 TRINITY_DN35004_c0_g3~~TRINITY_DN35004_c0_g3_i2.p1  ORF type:complete len:1423 (+),score=278.40 TRINITY_DN35004_c0_g3_i2:145-4413(+)
MAAAVGASNKTHGLSVLLPKADQGVALDAPWSEGLLLRDAFYRRHIAKDIESAADVLENAPLAHIDHGGLATDYVRRKQAARMPRLAAVTRADRDRGLRKQIHRTHKAAGVFLSVDPALAELVRTEELADGIRRAVTHFWKRRRHAAFPRQGLQDLRRHVAWLASNAKHQRLLQSALSCSRLTLKYRAVTTVSNDTTEKQVRLDEFWKDFRQGVRQESAGGLAQESLSGGSPPDSPASGARFKAPASRNPAGKQNSGVGTAGLRPLPQLRSAGDKWEWIEANETKTAITAPKSARQRKTMQRCAKGHPCPDGIRQCRVCGQPLKPGKAAQAWRAQLPDQPLSSREIRLPRLSPHSGDGCAQRSAEADAGAAPAVGRKNAGALAQSRGSEADAQDSSRSHYLVECHRLNVAPVQLPCLVGFHKEALRAAGRMLQDNDIMPLTRMLQDGDGVEEVDLSDNAMITKDAMIPFFDALATRKQIPLLRLLLPRCRSLGDSCVQHLVNTMQDKLQRLEILNLSGIDLSIEAALSLSRVLRWHPSMRALALASCKLGQPQSAQLWETLTNICGCGTMNTLDLSWNALGAETCGHLGSCVAESQSIRRLNLRNCSAGKSLGQDAPVEYFLEKLAADCSVTALDVSANHIDYRGALVLEDALGKFSSLKELVVSDNNLGVLGTRSVLRLLASGENKLVTCPCMGTEAGPVVKDSADSKQIFNPFQPGGRYSLILTRPYHRTLLRMLYKTAERFKTPAADVFSQIRWSHGNYTHPQKKDHKWQVESKGTLSFDFKIDWTSQGFLQGVGETDFSGFFDAHFHFLRFRPSPSKIIALLAHWRTIVVDGSNGLRNMTLAAVSADFVLTLPVLRVLCAEAPTHISGTIFRLLNCLAGGQAARHFSMMAFPSSGDLTRNWQRLSTLLSFNPDNPSDNYDLALDSPPDYYIAERMLLLDRWEVAVDNCHKRVDVSQLGDRSHFRNVIFQGKPLPVAVFEWNMPAYGSLSFDYSSSKRPPSDAQPLDADAHANVVQALQSRSALLVGLRLLDALRPFSSYLWLTALQLRTILGVFPTDRLRCHAFVLLIFRLVDIHNEKLVRARFTDMGQIKQICSRLGYATVFPFIQPDNSTFDFYLGHNDQRIAAHQLILYAQKEHVINLRQPSYVDGDGVEDPLILGVPRSWADLEKLPAAGVFTVTYVCAPDHRNYQMRKAALRSLTLFDCAHDEDEVMWWSSCADAPKDVNEFMEFVVMTFPSLETAFAAFDGVNGNGKISMSEFKDGLRRLRFDKFKGGGHVEQRIESVFRFLDPSSEGTISKKEWTALNELWKEMSLSLLEFVQFLERTVSQSPDVLDTAWYILDEDGNGEISQAEWTEVVERRLGYFGPSQTIFGFLDSDVNSGSISFQEGVHRLRGIPQQELRRCCQFRGRGFREGLEAL